MKRASWFRRRRADLDIELPFRRSDSQRANASEDAKLKPVCIYPYKKRGHCHWIPSTAIEMAASVCSFPIAQVGNTLTTTGPALFCCAPGTATGPLVAAANTGITSDWDELWRQRATVTDSPWKSGLWPACTVAVLICYDSIRSVTVTAI